MNAPVAIAAVAASVAAVASTSGFLTLAWVVLRGTPPLLQGPPIGSGSGGIARGTPAPAPSPLPKPKRTRAAPQSPYSGVNDIERTLAPELTRLHEEAVGRGEETYTDPETGFTVFTRLAHLRRGKCCGSRCRHCPYNHVNVPANRKAAAAALAATEAAVATVTATEAAAAPPHSVVYTKSGDKGTSALFTGERRKKTDAVFEALGAVDELSSHVGLARAMLRDMATAAKGEIELMATLEAIQQELLNAGTVIATPAAQQLQEKGPEHSVVKLLESYGFLEKTVELEKMIDRMDAGLEPLRIFILPGGGNVASAQLHVCRTVCRRAERRMIDVREAQGERYTDHLRQATVYVNRLSDFFFVAARSVAEEDIVRKYD